MPGIKSKDRITLVRLLAINKRLSNRQMPISARELAEEWRADIGEISERTIIKDLRFLKKVGAPVKYDRENGGWYYAVRDFNISETEFIKRLLIIDSEIRHGHYPSIKKLVAKCGVSERTIKRDLEFLVIWPEAPLKYNRKEKGYYYSNNDFIVPHIKKIIYSDGNSFKHWARKN